MNKLGDVSRLLSRISGGSPGSTICSRVAAKFGHDCVFCRFIGWVLRDPDHCWNERLEDLTRGNS